MGKFSELGQAVMHPMKIGLGLALLLHVAAGLSPHAEAKLAAFRAKLEAKEAGAAAPGRRPHFDETGAVVQDNPKGPQVDIMPGKLPGAGAVPPPGLPDDTSTQDSIMS